VTESVVHGLTGLLVCDRSVLPPLYTALAVMDDRVLRSNQRLIRRPRRFVSRVSISIHGSLGLNKMLFTEHFLSLRRFISRLIQF
jgi:hypothetical protein